MPELPEVETTRRGLSPWLTGAELLSVVVRNDSLRWQVPTSSLNNLVGQTIVKVERRAKYLLLYFPSAIVLMHLGMSGTMRVLRPIEPTNKHDHIDFLIKPVNHQTRVVRFNDPRRFGCCLVVEGSDGELSEHRLIVNLGPEPLRDEFDGNYLFRLSRKRTLAIKNFIMDNKVVVGVGNIYASEALHLAGIRPGVAAGRVTRSRYQDLADAIQKVLIKAIGAGGTTLNTFTQSDGQPGYFSHELQVYGRTGKACFRCGGTIKTRTLGQRSTFYCPACQS